MANNLHALLFLFLFSISLSFGLSASEKSTRGVYVPHPKIMDEARNALLIGNQSYRSARSLRNPKNDTKILAQVLSERGFSVKRKTNLSREKFLDQVSKFAEQLRNSDGVGLLYFAGHGIQVSGQNYLLPVDADIRKVSDIEVQGIPVQHIVNTLQQATNRLNIVILDSCRNNPFAGREISGSKRSISRGLAPVMPPMGTLIAFSTAPGQTAADGTGRNSPYTNALSKSILHEGLSIEQVMKRTRGEVWSATDGAQIPWEQTSLIGDFYFSPAIKTVTKVTCPPGSQFDGQNCVADAVSCPDGFRWTNDACISTLTSTSVKSTQDTNADIDRSLLCNDGQECSSRGNTFRHEGDFLKAALYFREGCSRGSGYGCKQLGDIYSTGKELETDRSKALDFYQKGCTLYSSKACLAAADMNKLLPTPDQDSLTLYEKSCEYGSAKGCNNAALMYLEGGTQPKNTMAYELFRKACADGEGEACYHLATSFRSAEPLSPDKNAASKLRIACEGHYFLACHELANHYINGTGVSRSYAEAEILYQKACANKIAIACTGVGVLYDSVSRLKKTKKESVEFLVLGCRLGDTLGCFHAARFYDQEDDEQSQNTAIELYSIGCDLDGGGSCNNLGVAYHQGLGVRENAETALKYFRKGCAFEDLTACENVEILLTPSISYANTSNLSNLVSECKTDLAVSCSKLGLIHEKGLGIKKNHRKAKQYFRAGCAAVDPFSCWKLNNI